MKNSIPDKKQEQKSGTIISADLHHRLLKILKKNFVNIYRIIYQINQPESDSFKARNSYYHSKKHPIAEESSGSSCCGSFFSKVYIPETEQSPLERCIVDLLSPSEFLLFSKALIEKLAETFFRIKNQGIKDKLPWDRDNEQYVLHEVLKEGVQNEIMKEVKSRMLREQKVDSKQPGLVATPSIWEKMHSNIKLDSLQSSTIEKLMTKHFAFQSDFINNRDFVRDLYKELHYLSLESKFEEMIQEFEVRSDRSFWVSLNEIEKKDFRSLHYICLLLSSLPYELNKKNTKLFTQISETFQISYFPEKSLHKLHMDSSFESTSDNGKTLSCLYFCNLDPDDKNSFGKIKVFNRITDKSLSEKERKEEYFEELDMEWDGLLVLKSRKIGYEIPENKTGKKFIIRLWINGPADVINHEF